MKPSSRSAEREILFRHFFFAKRNQSLIDCNGAKRNFFSFVPLVSKKKAGWEFCFCFVFFLKAKLCDRQYIALCRKSAEKPHDKPRTTENHPKKKISPKTFAKVFGETGVRGKRTFFEKSPLPTKKLFASQAPKPIKGHGPEDSCGYNHEEIAQAAADIHAEKGVQRFF